jgi:hypothetical protein
MPSKKFSTFRCGKEISSEARGNRVYVVVSSHILELLMEIFESTKLLQLLFRKILFRVSSLLFSFFKREISFK